jgi:glycosyltransferase involved in cell wall biosynthesis
LTARKRYKVIDINTLPDFLVFAALIPKMMGAKVLLDMHEIMPEFYMSKYGVEYDHWIIRLIRWQEKISMKFADYVLTINKPIQELLESRGLPLNKSDIIMNSTNEDLFNVINLKDSHRVNNKFIMMYHGTLTYIYGLDIALAAFAKVHVKIPKAEFWIIGDGPERENLERFTQQSDLKDKVKFFGVIPQDEVPKRVWQCDAGVLATRQDAFLDLSFSNKLSEYITLGKPVIVSRLKTIRSYFSEQALAYFEPHDTSDLAEKMVEIYHKSELRQELIDQAKLEFRPIRWDIMRRRHLKVIEILCR